MEDFVKTRNELAVELRKAGKDEAASQMAALRKPTLSPWVVNQLARSHKGDMEKLVKTGRALEKAQRAAVSGKKQAGYETLKREEGEVLRRLRKAAREILPRLSDSALDRVLTTLRAGAATEQGRQALLSGQLSADLEPPGFEAWTISGEIPPGPEAAAKESKKAEQLRKRLEEAREELRAKKSEARELARQAEEAEKLAGQLSRAAAAARRRADLAGARLEQIEEQLARS